MKNIEGNSSFRDLSETIWAVLPNTEPQLIGVSVQSSQLKLLDSSNKPTRMHIFITFLSTVRARTGPVIRKLVIYTEHKHRTTCYKNKIKYYFKWTAYYST